MIIFIPVRLNSVRLPQKALADIKGLPMMIQVGKRAKESQVGEVIFACGDAELVEMAERHGFKAVLTDPLLPTGTDRVYAGFEALNTTEQYIINLQGDMPFIDPTTIAKTAEMLKSSGGDMSTAACIQTDREVLQSPSVAKVVINSHGKALYFSRTHPFPFGEGNYYQHHGIYGYTAKALKRFVALPQTPLEKRENLEQLRALEHDMSIHVAIVNDCPKSVDVPQDLIEVRG